MEKLKMSLTRTITLYDSGKIKNIYPTKEDGKREALKRKVTSGQDNNMVSESKTNPSSAIKMIPTAMKTINL